MNNHVIYPTVKQDDSRLIVMIDESVSGTTYFGWALPGSSESGAFWKIWKLVESTGITSIKKADGNDLFDNVWSNRSSLTYL